MDAPVLSLVVVSYRMGELLADCLRSARAALAEVSGETELILVMNGTSAAESATGESALEGVELVEEPENIGFAAAVSDGIRHSGGEWIALLNDDATVEPRAFALMLEAGRSGADVGSIAAQMRFSDRPQVINSAGVEVDRIGVAYDRLLGEPVDASEREVTEVFGACGGAALYRREMLEQIGGFDESFYAYLEDVDVAWRARMSGWRCLYVPDAVVHHHHSSTLGHGSRRKHFLVGRNRVRLLARNATAAQLRRYGARMLLHDSGYVLFVAVRSWTLAPLWGRLAGLKEWRRYRRAGAPGRRAVPLVRVAGFRAALRRQRAWSSRP